MRNSQNVTIGLLLISAAVLAALLAVSWIDTPVAHAEPAIRGGDYLMTAGRISSSRDLLYVVDGAVQKMNVYTVNLNNGSLEVVDTVDLSKAFGAAKARR